MTDTASRKTTLRAQGLSCPSCVAKIESSLRHLDGVSNAQVYFETGRIVVEHDPSIASKDALVRAVKDAGYEAKATAF